MPRPSSANDGTEKGTRGMFGAFRGHHPQPNGAVPHLSASAHHSPVHTHAVLWGVRTREIARPVPSRGRQRAAALHCTMPRTGSVHAPHRNRALCDSFAPAGQACSRATRARSLRSLTRAFGETSRAGLAGAHTRYKAKYRG